MQSTRETPELLLKGSQACRAPGRPLGSSGMPPEQGCPWLEQPSSQGSDGLGGDAAAQGQAEVSDGQDNFGTGHGGNLHQL